MQIFATYTGPDFLTFYAIMLATCVGLALWLPAFLRPEGRLREVDDPEELAVLAGGAPRHTAAILTDLMVQDALRPSGRTRMAVARSSADTGRAGAAILRKVGAFSLAEAARTIKHQTEAIADDLVRRGLLMDKSEWLQLRLFAIAPFALLLVLGMYRQQAGAALGEPTGYLVAMMVVTILFAALRWGTVGLRTRAGNQVLSNWVKRSSRLKRAPQGHETALAVGLFGTAVLAGTPLSHLHAMKQAGSGDSGTSGDGDGGGGCGGGGCGG
ncbi:MAG: TIGR04222 domain-containing membrane protein [Erythrobacter sp.]